MKKDIRHQIFSGYKSLIIVIAAIVVITGAYLITIGMRVTSLSESRKHQISTGTAIIAHTDWINLLTNSILSKREFTGGTDPKNCSLGKWISGLTEEELAKPGITNIINAVKTPHELIHKEVISVVELNKTEPSAAYYRFTNEIKPNVDIVISNLNKLNDFYENEANTIEAKVNNQLSSLINTLIILAVLAIIFSIWFGNRTAKKIVKPIAAVVDWSKKLALGVDNLDFDAAEFALSDNKDNEIAMMVDSFKAMADSIKENVNVVAKVADGDMTAFVNIRSREDSLGKNLYKMVQTNDLMFAEILHVATDVADGSDSISKASQELADSTNAQAAAVEEISGIIEEISRSIVASGKKATEATNISDEIKEDVKFSNEKMEMLVSSVDEIRTASERVSMVIKSIDDIAFQTNILALNAAVEAARAGVAGKGFAVVADEVRNLASKSAEAAKESKLLIENTIDKTNQGSRISSEATATYSEIVSKVNELLDIIVEISRAAEEQNESVAQVNAGMQMVSMAASNNAHATEQSATASMAMNANADELKKAMGKFNLRKRQQGKPYIPPEKQNDKAFIAEASKNYNQSLKTGRSAFISN